MANILICAYMLCSVKRKTKPKRENKNRQSQSLQTTIERAKATMSRTKIDAIKQRLETSTRSRVSDNKSSKVQMILDRHNKMKETQQHSENYRTLKFKISKLSKKARREKNNSNISMGPPQSTFLNFTLESGL